MRTAPLARSAPRRLIASALAVALALFALVARPTPVHAQSNGAALTPLMGWSSWSFLRSSPTGAKIKAQASAMSTSGLVAAGYRYINLDDFWYLNPGSTVDAYGRWVTDSSKFPDGMANLGSYIHGLGEKFGMYLTPGIPVAAYNQNTPIQGTSFHARDVVSNTSSYETNYNFGSGTMYYIDYSKNPSAAQAFLNSWADELAGYGIDYLKIDGVSPNDGDSQAVADVQHWAQALNQTGRTIHLELSNSLTVGDAASWQQSANGWRIDGDVECYCGSNGSSYPLTDWNNVKGRFTDVVPWIGVGTTGGWNDLDSVEIGNGNNDGLTLDERKTQLTLWAIENSNLTLGVDMTNLDSTDLGLMTNSEVLAVDQDGHPARPVDATTQLQAWYAPNGDGSYAVALFNLSGSTATVSVNWQDIGFTGSSASVHDDWSHADMGTFATGYSVSLPTHGTTLLKVTPTGPVTYTALSYNVVNANSGMDLAVSGNSTAAGAGIVQQTADNALDQEWQLVPVGDGTYKLINRNSHLQLTAPSSAQGAQLTQNTDDNATDSRWRLTPTGSGYAMSNQTDGMLADVSGGSKTAGASVIQWPSNGGANQHWTLVPVPDANQSYRVENRMTGGRIDVNNDSTANGATLLEWSDNGRADQRWTFVKQPNGTYAIVNANSGKLVNIPGPTTNQGTQLIQYADDGGSNSRWTLVDEGPGVIGIKSVYDGQMIDLSDGNPALGTAVIQWPDNGGLNQHWALTP
jgi:hypothetical protein